MEGSSTIMASAASPNKTRVRETGQESLTKTQLYFSIVKTLRRARWEGRHPAAGQNAFIFQQTRLFRSNCSRCVGVSEGIKHISPKSLIKYFKGASLHICTLRRMVVGIFLRCGSESHHIPPYEFWNYIENRVL